MQSRAFPVILLIFLVAIAVVNGLAGVYHWYWEMRWFDMPMHFAGGVWLAGFAVWWQYSRRGIAVQSFPRLLGVCLVYALSIGLVWEAYEAVVSYLTGGEMNEILDTLSDLLFDMLGGATVATLVWAQAKLLTNFELRNSLSGCREEGVLSVATRKLQTFLSFKKVVPSERHPE